jgi:hypothetical protein
MNSARALARARAARYEAPRRWIVTRKALVSGLALLVLLAARAAVAEDHSAKQSSSSYELAISGMT